MAKSKLRHHTRVMTIAGKIKDFLMPKALGTAVKEVRIGLIYTAVMLENGGTGVAFTFQGGPERETRSLKGLHPMAGRDASELLSLLDSPQRVGAALGLATANALTNAEREGLHPGDVLDFLPIGPADRVGMVGYFAPVLPRIKKKGASVLVFEQKAEREGEILPEEEAYRLLPECQVALVTSTTIVNHTVDGILEAARACRDVALVGASTPLLAEAFADTNVKLLSGIIITEPEAILRMVSEAGGSRAFRGNVRKVNLLLGTGGF
ncbi:MAG: DUF364 domain-containing protein [Deltaproteobacteria bacterium]|nr:DUF364 domain-containing protein [Deltaproteobacteria bacterium]